MKYIVFDLEATCWRGHPPGGISEIIEIGAVMINRYGEVSRQFSKFVRPQVNPYLSGFCKSLTSIQQSDVDGASTYPRVIHDFTEWIDIYDGDFALLSWGVDDLKLLRQNCNLYDLEQEWLENYSDLKRAYKRLKRMNNASGLKSTVKREGFEFTGQHHRAISDAENLAKIFIKYLEDWEI